MDSGRRTGERSRRLARTAARTAMGSVGRARTPVSEHIPAGPKTPTTGRAQPVRMTRSGHRDVDGGRRSSTARPSQPVRQVGGTDKKRPVDPCRSSSVIGDRGPLPLGPGVEISLTSGQTKDRTPSESAQPPLAEVTSRTTTGRRHLVGRPRTSELSNTLERQCRMPRSTLNPRTGS